MAKNKKKQNTVLEPAVEEVITSASELQEQPKAKQKKQKVKEAVTSIEPNIEVEPTQPAENIQPTNEVTPEMPDKKKARKEVKKKGTKEVQEGTFEEDGVVYKTPRIL